MTFYYYYAMNSLALHNNNNDNNNNDYTFMSCLKQDTKQNLSTPFNQKEPSKRAAIKTLAKRYYNY